MGEQIKLARLPYAVRETEEQEKRSYLDMMVNTVVTRDMIDFVAKELSGKQYYGNTICKVSGLEKIVP